MLKGEKLQTDQGPAAIIINNGTKGPFVIVCEHGGKVIPSAMGDMGLSGPELTSHIAWDPGARQVATRLAQKLSATLVLQRYSRLIYDCNRPPSSPEAMRKKSENIDISGNADLSEAEKNWRIENIYGAFHSAITTELDQVAAGDRDPVLVTIHSFTPVYHGKTREVDLGILHDTDTRLADVVIDANGFDAGVRVRRNEPYGPDDGVTHTLQKHGQARGILNVMIEIRNDLISDETSQHHYGDQLAEILANAVTKITDQAA